MENFHITLISFDKTIDLERCGDYEYWRIIERIVYMFDQYMTESEFTPIKPEEIPSLIELAKSSSECDPTVGHFPNWDFVGAVYRLCGKARWAICPKCNQRFCDVEMHACDYEPKD